MRVSAGQPFLNYCTMTISRLVLMTMFRFVICLRTILCRRLTLSKLQSPRNSLTLRFFLLILSALFHLCNCSNPSPLLRSLNFFQLFHHNVAVEIIFKFAIIKQCSPVFSDFIAYIANLSFSQGTFKSKFKHASVTPLLKKPGLNPSVSTNFRPISNLNNITKILERLFLTRLQPHIALSSNFNPLQSAYCKHHSTETS